MLPYNISFHISKGNIILPFSCFSMLQLFFLLLIISVTKDVVVHPTPGLLSEFNWPYPYINSTNVHVRVSYALAISADCQFVFTAFDGRMFVSWGAVWDHFLTVCSVYWNKPALLDGVVIAKLCLIFRVSLIIKVLCHNNNNNINNKKK